MHTNKHILYVAGTRPEVIKVAPAVIASRKLGSDVTFLLTGQHREMAHQVLASFGIEADLDLDIMQAGATLADISSRLIQRLAGYLSEKRPGIMVVQGDTSSAAIGGLMAFYERIPVAHIEAGLRSGNKFHPFPEEVNRKIIGTYADLNFAPTALARDNLLRENVAPESILVTGNTVVDAAALIAPALSPRSAASNRQLLVTTHRRENWNDEIEQICKALIDIVHKYADVSVLLPVHRNPIVYKQIHSLLDGQDRIQLTEPLNYVQLHDALKQSHLVLTDSGGIQEEAPIYGVPSLALREVTERPEAAQAGVARIIGTRREKIVEEVSHLLDKPEAYAKMAHTANPFGDGKAADRIARSLQHYLEDPASVRDKVEEFIY